METGSIDNLLERLRDPAQKPVCAGPLAGWTDASYRAVLKICGTQHLWIPFVSSHAVAHARNPNHDSYVREVAIENAHTQIFGANPEINSKAAKILEDHGALSIDFNCGCSVKKVHRGGGGSALLKDIDLLTENLVAIKNAVNVPVSLKTRIGFYTQDDFSGIEACKRAADLGYAWVTLHGRTAKQKFSGGADLDAIAGLVDKIGIPVIGNGDVETPQDAARMFEVTGCAGVMIGRGIMGNPWLVSDCEAFLTGGSRPVERTRAEKSKIMLEHQDNLLKNYPDSRGVLEFRKHISRYLRGFSGASAIRSRLVTLDDPVEVTEIIRKFGTGTHIGHFDVELFQ